MYSRIWTSKLKDYKFDGTSPQRGIKIEKFNLFIGANNSGKSRFIRQLFSAPRDTLSFEIDLLNKELKSALHPFFQNYAKNESILQIYVTGEEIHQINQGLFCTGNEYTTLFEKISALLRAVDNPNLTITGLDEEGRRVLNQIISDVKIAKASKIVIQIPPSTVKKTEARKRFYIPILRGLRPLASDKVDHYYARTISDYFLIDGENIIDKNKDEIDTGFNLYDLFSKFLLGKPEQRARIREYEKLLGQEFFGGQNITLIPEYGADTISVQVGDNEQRSISHLGDGLQQVIIITSSAYLQTDESIFFIEEPEQSLHPGLLRQLAIFLIEKTKHQYFVTTHSNHLLDLSETNKNVSIYRFIKSKDEAEKETFEIKNALKDRDILNDLGIHPSSVYLSNSTIWIEGITDRFYIRVFMEKYINQLTDESTKRRYQGYLENFHYAFVEYQGGTIGHWLFGDSDEDSEEPGLKVIQLCGKAFLICDGDIKSKRDRYELLSKELGESLFVLNAKEIENILPKDIILLLAKKQFEKRRIDKSSYSIEKLDSLGADYFLHEKHGIGYLLDKALSKDLKGKGKKNIRVFAAPSGTIRDKVEFCINAIELMKTTEWKLTPSINSLCEKIFNHIENANSFQSKIS